MARPRTSGVHRRPALCVPAGCAHRLRSDGLRATALARRSRSLCDWRGAAASGPPARRRTPGSGLDRARAGRERGPLAAAGTVRASLLVPLVLGGLAALAASQTPVSDSDLFWHLAIGRDVAAHGIARLEMYSWTVAGRPVLVDQWLGEIVLSVAYAIGSWRGIITLRAILVGAIAALRVWTVLVERPRPPLISVLAALPALALSRFART